MAAEVEDVVVPAGAVEGEEIAPDRGDLLLDEGVGSLEDRLAGLLGRVGRTRIFPENTLSVRNR